MQRVWILGSSGSGKTTLANVIGNKLGVPVYYNDRIFLDGKLAGTPNK